MLRTEVRILAVDDVSSMRNQIRSLLILAGFHDITFAKDGSEAKKLLATEKFHIILCDWHMEPMDGLELLKFIRTDTKLESTPFIMVTADNTADKVIEAIRYGVDEYIVKPLTIQQIEEKVLKTLIRKKVL